MRHAGEAVELTEDVLDTGARQGGQRAAVIGGIEVISIIAGRFGIESGPLAWVAELDLNHVGYAIVILFVATWIVALLLWRYGRIEERWTSRLTASDTAPAEQPS